MSPTDMQEYVTRYELELVVKPIADSQRRIEEKLDNELAEQRADIKAWKMLAEQKAFLGGRGRTVANGLLIALPAGAVSAVMALILHHH